ncbi:histone-lysine N-methyltransferase ASHH1-like protein, putative [Medicago truncatula]|uniref:Histone-lysine N-methyltransferase ASHH1-like protein, putative n=1 Tax=Medicago truncatula TaxID=3880 RepID=G7IAJ9_MEDTR|nr:histone-lysine N-methyltransferase ASHH1-like protein, putative [Medicago truncatula]
MKETEVEDPHAAEDLPQYIHINQNDFFMRRYSIEKIPLYDSAEDELTSNVGGQSEQSMAIILKVEEPSESTVLNIQPLNSIGINGLGIQKMKTEIESEDMRLYSQDTKQDLPQKNAMISRIRSNTAGGKSISTKRSKGGKEAQEEILDYEKRKYDATEALDSLYNEIWPAIEEHEKDTQDSVSTTVVAEKWIQASCLKLQGRV